MICCITALVFDVIEKCREIPIAAIQPEPGRVAIRGQRLCRIISDLVPIDDVNRFHIGFR
jgi:hypothetical protein